ncbi:hypothetical protein ATE80_04590 [Streptomyces kanasensis]|uniref:DUF4232 domain-containing protein n=1 Tax=Streptomyces kanasensis TaxID=936756 RepID=A0A124ED68_9ACTN|nr:hypothetical protein ATE80_04590 [Streptomyces kanasensis]
MNNGHDGDLHAAGQDSSETHTPDTTTPDTSGPDNGGADTTGPDTSDPDASGTDGRGADAPGRDTPATDAPGTAGALGAGPDATGTDGTGADARDGDTPATDADADGLLVDELALRRMLHTAVGDIRPSDDVLDHLRRAVPARRARKRQAIVGAAAAVILLGTGVPAFVHVAASDSASDANPVNAGHGEQVQGGTGDAIKGATGEETTGGPSGTPASKAKGGKDPKEKPQAAASGATDGADGTADPSTSATAALPVCDPGQLGVVSADAGSPGSDGTVYGTFRISNVSSTDCVVDGVGTVGFRANGAADQNRISVVTHTSGDAAGGLPDPSASVSHLTLKPSAAYDVKFAWVPAETCPTDGGNTPDPTPSPTTEPTPATGGTGTGAAEGGGAESGAGAATEPQLVSEGGTADGSVSVTHTPDVGGPTAEATVPDACTGTIYRTGLLPAQ